jgi:nitroreductase
METLISMKTRRSIRKYKKDKISDEQLEEIVKCGMFAPSAGNEQPWHFIIIKNKKILRQIPQIHEHAQMMNEAAAGILVCYDLDLETHDSMAVQDCSAATQNILLAIHDLGLGGCWIGVYPRKKRMDGLGNLFNLPENIVPFSLVSIGLPDEHKENINRFNKERLHNDTW